MKTILITGGSGFFGVNAARHYERAGCRILSASSQPERYATFEGESNNNDNRRFLRLDVTDTNAATALLERERPDAVIHAAAMSQPGLCERAPEEAFRANAGGTASMLEAARRADTPLIFLSTDLVFSGNRSEGQPLYAETDAPDATIVYGKSKIAAEELLRQSAFDKWLILRPALMFGRGAAWTNGFPQFAAKLLKSGKTATLFTDQYRTPVYIPDLCEAISLLLEKRIFGEIFHAGGAERLNRAEFVERYCAAAGLSTEGIRAVTMDEVPDYTTRVRDVSLDSSKLIRAVSWRRTPFAEDFQEIVENDVEK